MNIFQTSKTFVKLYSKQFSFSSRENSNHSRPIILKNAMFLPAGTFFLPLSRADARETAIEIHSTVHKKEFCTVPVFTVVDSHMRTPHTYTLHVQYVVLPAVPRCSTEYTKCTRCEYCVLCECTHTKNTHTAECTTTHIQYCCVLLLSVY